ncbi:MAG: hypothetical protein ACRDRX_23810 [Pseudonocardiaceae bacterium]
MSTISLATHAGITVRYLEMIEADSKTPLIPVLRKLATTNLSIGRPEGCMAETSVVSLHLVAVPRRQ